MRVVLRSYKTKFFTVVKGSGLVLFVAACIVSWGSNKTNNNYLIKNRLIKATDQYNIISFLVLFVIELFFFMMMDFFWVKVRNHYV